MSFINCTSIILIFPCFNFACTVYMCNTHYNPAQLQSTGCGTGV